MKEAKLKKAHRLLSEAADILEGYGGNSHKETIDQVWDMADSAAGLLAEIIK